MALQVLAGTGKSKSPTADGGYFSITAQDKEGTNIAVTTSKIQFKADFTGKSTLDTKSAPSDLRILSLSAKAETLQQKLALRSAMDLMYCPKEAASCTDSDWVKQACDAPDCTIKGATVQLSTTKLGTYVLHGSSSYVVPGEEGEDGTSAASYISVALSLVVAALVCVFV